MSNELDYKAATGYAKTLAINLHAKYNDRNSQWKPLDDLMGLLTQIDNLTCWLVNKDEIERLRVALLGGLFAQKHTGMKISAHGVLGRIRDVRYYKELNYGCGEMLRHLEEMAERFYSGDLKAVDEFLQLYDLDQKRPVMTNQL